MKTFKLFNYKGSSIFGLLLIILLTQGCGGSSTKSAGDSVATTSAPLKKIKLGFIPLTDCAPLVVAKELGYNERRTNAVSVFL